MSKKTEPIDLKIINGLRFIAIILLILSNFKLGFINSGTKIGTDMLLVISGYAITYQISSLIYQHNYQKFLKYFWYHRILHMPVLLFTCSITFIAVFIYMSPYKLFEYGHGAWNSLLSYANYYFVDEHHLDHFNFIDSASPFFIIGIYRWLINLVYFGL